MPRVPRSDGGYRPYRGNPWRVIEGQHRPSTMRIVDTDNEQAVLEQVLETSKPPVPQECLHLDYQFWSPFRYGNYPRASRFRRAGLTPGVWYGSEAPITAVAESIWGALRFFAASPDTPMPRWPVEHTAVQAEISTPFCADLAGSDWVNAGNWDDPDDYSECLDLADRVRAAGAEAIRYASVRHPGHAANLAVLTCTAFARPAPIAFQTWHILLKPTLVRAHCETLRRRYMFAVGETRLNWG